MFVTPAYAQATGAAGAAPGGMDILIQFAPIVILVIIFWLLIFRPQQKKLREQRAMLSAITRGDTVVTTGGLVGKEDGGTAGQRPGHGHALLLSAGELRRVVLHAVGHPHPLERVLHAILPLAGGHVSVGEGELDVLEHVEIADEVEGLEDEADLAVAYARALGRIDGRNRFAVEPVAPAAGGVEETEDRQQGRLAAARGTRDRDVLAVADLQVNVR